MPHRIAGRRRTLAFHRNTISGLTGWLDAADESTVTESGGVITQVADKGPFSRTFSTFDVTKRPTYSRNAINGRNAINFDSGLNKYIGYSALRPASEMHHGGVTLAFVYKARSISSTFFRYGSTSTDPNAIGLTLRMRRFSSLVSVESPSLSTTSIAPTSLVFIVWRVPISGPASFFYQDESRTVTAEGSSPNYMSSATAPHSWNFGNPSNGFDGLLGEILHYNRFISNSEVSMIVSYFRNKWGMIP